MRINKYIASTGLTSRRHAEDLVRAGKISVNGKVIADLAFDVSAKDVVELDSKPINKTEYRYIMMHKPKGYITSLSDDRGRKTIDKLIPPQFAGVKPVGRLDYNTEGLLLLTTDGDLAHKLTLPANEVEKTYIAKVEGKMTESQLAVMRAGVVIDGIRLKKCKVQIIETKDNFTKLQIKITEGKNRQIRKMFDAVGVNVVFLKRTAIAGLKLGGLARGKCRELSPAEVEYLIKL